MRIVIFLMLCTSILAKKSFTNKEIKEINAELKECNNLIQKEKYRSTQKKLSVLHDKYPDLDITAWWSKYHQSLGSFHTKKNNFYEATIEYRKAFEYRPTEITLNSLATAYIQNKQFFDASNLLESNSKYVSEINRAKYEQKIAFAYAQMQNFQGAIYRTKKLINLQPKNPKHWSILSIYYMKNSQPEYALEALEELETMRPLKRSEKELKIQASQKTKIGNKLDVAVSSSFEVQLDNQKYREYIPTILRILDEAYIELGRIFNFYPKLKTRVNILTDQNYIHAAGNNFSIGMRTLNSDEIYIRLNKSNNFNHPEKLRSTIWHEYNHHLLILKTNGMGAIPHWFIEGIAMYLEPRKPSIRDQKIMKTLVKSNLLFNSENLPVRIQNYQMYLMARSMVEYLDQERHLEGIIDNLNQLTFSYKFTDLFEEITGINQLAFTDQWNIKTTAQFTPENLN